jgi:hypothetical protein
MKKIKFPKVRIPILPIIIFLGSLVLVYGLIVFVKTTQENQKNHQEFRGNIENLYYYLKKEPSNFEMYAVLNKGDSVALSVWYNYLSTSDDTIKKYEKQLINMKDGILPKTRIVKGKVVQLTYSTKKYPEFFLVERMQQALVLFQEIRNSNKNRIEIKKDFDEKKYKEKKTELVEMLKKITEEAKKVNLDLR